MRVLVTGGAGYIGSVLAEQLLEEGHKVWVYDNLVHGHRKAVPRDAIFIQDNLLDTMALREALCSHAIEAVIHRAAHSQVGESMTAPDKYYRNNVLGTLNLLSAMVDCGVKLLVFSSTAAVYGEPPKQPIEEDDPLRPTNPYGDTKLACSRKVRQELGWLPRHQDLGAIVSSAWRWMNAREHELETVSATPPFAPDETSPQRLWNNS
jgi:UDP-glucose 4-epimerase